MNTLLSAIVLWLAANFALPANYEHPNVVLDTEARMTQLRYGADPQPKMPGVVAVYDDEKCVIMLPNSWTGRTPAELSILVHEMVHHLQNKAGLRYACAGEREALAYAAQAKWLEQFKSDLEKEFGIDAFTLKIKTTCLLR